MAFMAVLENDLRALSAEARRRHPAVKDAAEHAILKLRSLSSPSEVAHNEDILRIFLMVSDVRSVKLSVIGLSCLQKLISHDAIAPSALKDILLTLKDHADMTDENVQLKTLQTVLIIFQSRLHPETEDDMAQALGICLRLLENTRSSDSVRNTAAATFRQAVALIFDNVVNAESLPAGKAITGAQLSRSSSVSHDVSRNINQSWDNNNASGQERFLRAHLSRPGKLGLRLLEDLTALAAGGSATWLRVHSLQRTFALEILEFVLSNYVTVFHSLESYEQVLRHQICSLLMTSLRTNVEIEGEADEPTFRRLVLRSVAHVIRLYNFSLVTECEVFLNMLIKVTRLDLPLWHRILALEIMRGFCVEVRTLRLLFQNFDMNPKNTNVVENMVKALARIVSSIQITDSSEESLVAVAGMFSSKAKGIEWSMDNDASNAAVLIASEAHAITLAVEGLLGVVFTIATLTDEAVDVGELESPKSDNDEPAEFTGETAHLCLLMVNSTWLTILDALSLILARSQGEAIVLEILKGYQAFTQACGVLHAVEPLNSFLASLCKFTFNIPNEVEKRSSFLSPVSKKSELYADQREHIVLTPKNVQALRTLFNVAHRLHNVLGSSWVLVLETLAGLDRVIHYPHASTQEVSTSVSRISREIAGQYTDFHILSSLNSQLFESSALMHISAVKALLTALRELCSQSVSGNTNNIGQSSSQQFSSVIFAVERMTSILVNNLHRVEPIWDLVVSHLVELADNLNQNLRNLALDALDKSICAVIGSASFQGANSSLHQISDSQVITTDDGTRSFEYAVLSPLFALYKTSQSLDVRSGSLKILLHVLERHAEKLYYSWPDILDMLRAVAAASEKELIPLGFQSLRIIMNEGLSTIPAQCLDVCIDVTGSFSAQKTEINISLTAIGLLWTATDFVVKGLGKQPIEESVEDAILSSRTVLTQSKNFSASGQIVRTTDGESQHSEASNPFDMTTLVNHNYDKLLLSIFSILQKLAADERPEIRNSAIRTLFQTLGTHGQKFSRSMWEDCLWDYVFPVLDRVFCLAATSSRDEWQGKELGVRGGKAVHMLIHHSRNTAQKQWDETIVLVLGWESLMSFIAESIYSGSKEVAVAALSCLQTTVGAHCFQGSMPVDYLKSVLKVYEEVLKKPPKHWSNATNKVKQEILQSLGDLYRQGEAMFDNDMYKQLLGVLHYAIRSSKSPSDLENNSGNLSMIERTLLDILPMLRPPKHLPAFWLDFLSELFICLPGNENSTIGFGQMASKMEDDVALEAFREENNLGSLTTKAKEIERISSEVPTDGTPTSIMKNSASFLQPKPTSPSGNLAFICNHLFGEKLIPVLVELYVQAPQVEKCRVVPEIIQCLGRCMSTRRDNPQGALWKIAVECFNRILVGEINSLHVDCALEPNLHRSARARFWKDVADVYETFLVGCCGRVLSSGAHNGDELIEMNFVGVLADKILKASLDAPGDILRRLVVTLDRCASRTGSLPVESVGLIPLHCIRFSLSCIQIMFSICSYDIKDDWHPTRSETSRVSLVILMQRCQHILKQFLADENDMGDQPLPAARLEETICILQELGRLVIHPYTSSALDLNPRLTLAPLESTNVGVRTHLLILFPSFCELVVSRESRVRELVQVLLRLVGAELGLHKI